MKIMEAAKKVSSYKRGELALLILKYCAIGIFIGGVIVCPNLAQLYKYLDPKTPYERRKIKRAAVKLYTQGYITKPTNSNSPLKPTLKGLRQSEFDSLTIQPTAKWDGKWHICMFDIPETKLPARKMFSMKVSEMGMKLFQKSVYISPYPCEKELSTVAQHFGVTQYIRFVVATDISVEENFKKIFNLQNI